DPLLVTAPGTVNFRSSVPVAATAFFTDTNESSELLISHTPIVDPVAYTQQVGGQTVTIPQFTEGAGWRNDVVLMNTTEDRMNGEVRFFDQAGQSMDVGIGDENTPLSVVEFDIPSRSFQKISTSGSATITEQPFAFTRGTSITTPGGGAFQQTGFASADSFDLSERLNGMQIIDY